MSHRHPPAWRAKLWVAGAVLALAQPPALARDLDDVPVEEFNRQILIELVKGFSRHGLQDNQEYTLAELQEEILYALSDADDGGDEGFIDEDDLKAEMTEARTTLAAVVMEALQAADEVAQRERRSRSPQFAADTRTGFLKVADVMGGFEERHARVRGDGMLSPPAVRRPLVTVLDRVVYGTK